MFGYWDAIIDSHFSTTEKGLMTPRVSQPILEPMASMSIVDVWMFYKALLLSFIS
jgi:hypothetical protein